MLRQNAHLRQGERGSVVVAMSVLMLLLLLGTTLITRSQAELGASSADADAEAAQAAAEQGVAEVLARLEAGETGSFSGDGEVTQGKYAYKAEQISDTEYFVRAEGYVGERARAVEVTIAGEATALYSLFVNHTGGFENNEGTIAGRVGSNGSLRVSGNPPGEAIDLFGPSASCSGCEATTSFEDPYPLPEPSLPEGSARTCPSDGIFTGTIDGNDGQPYVCSASSVGDDTTVVRFVGTVTVVNPPLIIHVLRGLDVRILDASVNTDGEPSDFQLTAEGTEEPYWWYNIWNSKVHGLLYAPNRYSHIGNVDIYGILSTGVFRGYESSPVWITPFDPGGSTPTGWTVTSWEQVPAS